MLLLKVVGMYRVILNEIYICETISIYFISYSECCKLSLKVVNECANECPIFLFTFGLIKMFLLILLILGF